MKLKELSLLFKTKLEALYPADEAEAIFLTVIADQLKFNRTDYLLKKDTVLDDNDLKQIESLLQQLQEGVPVQYAIGETYFYGLPFKVNPSVLIPRPETEELVEWVLEKAKDMALAKGRNERQTSNADRITILDIGTGSGCIAISIKKNLAKATVFALDISVESIETAKQNAALNNVEVEFMEQDILETPLSSFDSQISILKSQYSIIVSNPPYITTIEKQDMHANVLANEPHHALFVSNEKPLLFYEAIADFALMHLENKGLLFFEINEYLGKETVALLKDKGFNNIELKKDMQGKDRMICCERINLLKS
jgi:release factor glutamine methyltransferase